MGMVMGLALSCLTPAKTAAEQAHRQRAEEILRQREEEEALLKGGGIETGVVLVPLDPGNSNHNNKKKKKLPGPSRVLALVSPKRLATAARGAAFLPAFFAAFVMRFFSMWLFSMWLYLFQLATLATRPVRKMLPTVRSAASNDDESPSLDEEENLPQTFDFLEEEAD